ncbi:hypothetical protein PPL_03907 [Heterostelium album PN500]|uniref:DUF1446-domain-containing protein n=1 Tax=Heterostelium pallidum (strain ATCC 26659 / Pp 5 / PN500) TaxID=670386 RepID=D3B5G9_HETP5|nr:hypothetical protein PPL_03907 [Heterostelium album PN500]EFA83117.1 hypothetical protein PPL_03907 [Heterostelium album PN500]|eukprot:XP_020435234.1 hypothetical protein PPL_03907 [Heterostelium album PN500]
MGAADPKGAGEEALDIANSLGIDIRIVVVCEQTTANSDSPDTTTTTNTPTTTVYKKNSVNNSSQSKLVAIPSSNGFSVMDNSLNEEENENWEIGCTYLGADALIDALKLGADLVIAGRVADPSLFVAPIAYTFGWDLTKDFNLVAQATLAGHLLECGCHLTGGYFAHPLGRNTSFEKLADLSLPFCDIDRNGNIVIGKIEGSGGELSERTCKQQLTYEIGDPKEYITPDVIVNFSQVEFVELSENSVIARGAKGYSRPKDLLRLLAKSAGYKSWAEVSYGGLGCVERAQWASRLVHKWMEDKKKGITKNMMTYLVGYNSLYLQHGSRFQIPPSSLPSTIPDGYDGANWSASGYPPEVRLRFDGLFESREDAETLGMELQGLGLCGPAGGGGFAFGIRKDIRLVRHRVSKSNRGGTIKRTTNSSSRIALNNNNNNNSSSNTLQDFDKPFTTQNNHQIAYNIDKSWKNTVYSIIDTSRQSGRVLLYNIAHSRSGDKGDIANVSLIPYNPADYPRLQKVITPEWVMSVYKNLLKNESKVNIYQLPGIKGFNIVLSYALDGGVCVSRRVDRHGKTLSDVILNQWIDLPPLSSL